MTLWPWLALAAVLVATASGQLLYKLYFVRERDVRCVVAAIGLFLAAPVCSYLALHGGLTLGMVYMSTALTHLMVGGMSRAVLREPLTRHHAAALVLIAGGLVLYGC